MKKKFPKLRTVNKVVPAYELNEFPRQFPINVGRQLIYTLATRGAVDIEGKEWEAIFASSVGAEWKPSVVGLDDIVMGNTAWGAKSIKAKKPSVVTAIRLISGRNDLINSYDYLVQPGKKPEEHGELVLNIYNERVSSVREIYKHVRTIILIRSFTLLESIIFEIDTVRYDPELYFWEWGTGRGSKNLYGFDRNSKEQKFTWQSGGQQFTIFEKVPAKTLLINIKKPEQVQEGIVLDIIGYDESWITVKQNG